MSKIIKETTANALVVVSETYPDEETASNEQSQPENTECKVLEYKVEKTKWRKSE